MLFPLSDVAEVQQKASRSFYEEGLEKQGNQIHFGFLGKQD